MLKSVTFALIALNAAVFLFGMVSPATLNGFAFTPSQAFDEPWTFITSQFMHAGIMHIAFNMFTLFAFGPVLESRMRWWEFILFYLAAGVVGNLLQMGMAYSGFFEFINPNTPGVGASGAIMGVIGVLAILTPHIQMMVPILPIPVPMWIGAILFTLFNVGISFFDTNIGTGAHLGGLALGILVGFVLRRMMPGRGGSYDIVYEYE